MSERSRAGEPSPAETSPQGARSAEALDASAEEGALDAADARFHEAYEDVRGVLAREAPVMVLLADRLVTVTANGRCARPLAVAPFDVRKAAAHVAVGLYAALFESARAAAGEPLGAAAFARVTSLRNSAAEALDGLDADPTQGAGSDVLQLLRRSLAFADRVLHERRAPTRVQLAHFAASVRPALLAATREATRHQIDVLHGQVEAALAELDDDARARLTVVVAGDHQARRRAYGMQYFTRRFGEDEGDEERVLYGENVKDVDEALTLVGTQRIDRALAEDFFGDPRRMQRDILGDAAQEVLDDRTFAPLARASSTRARPPG